jgi:hypothetical protein
MLKTIIPLISVFVFFVCFAVRATIDEKLRDILEKDGKDPGIIEEELRWDTSSPDKRIDRFRRDIEIRKNVDSRLGLIYESTHIIGILSMLLGMLGFALL